MAENKGIIISGGRLEAEQVAVGDHAQAIKNIGGSVERPAQDEPQVELAAALSRWKQEIEAKIEALADLEADEKEELKARAAKVEAEAVKGQQADPGKLERWLNTMSVMAPDILEVTAAILQNPLAGVGLVLKKINDRIKLERQEQAS
jgi:hypothetical protein